MVPAAAGIFDARNLPGKHVNQPAEQRRAERHHAHLRDMIEVDVQPLICDTLNQRFKVAENARIADPFIIERRQYQHTANLPGEGVLGESDGVRQRGAPGSHQKPGGRNSAIHHGIEGRHPFRHAEGICFAGRSQQHDPAAAVRQQPAAVRGQQLMVDLQPAGDGGQAGGINTIRQAFRQSRHRVRSTHLPARSRQTDCRQPPTGGRPGPGSNRNNRPKILSAPAW